MSDDDDAAVLSLLATYAARLDAGDFRAGMAALFRDAVVTSERSGMHVSGAAEVHDIFERSTRRHSDGTPRTKHVTTNCIVEVDGDIATCRSCFTVFQQTDALPLQPIIAGRYHDRFRRARDGAWQFSRREIFIDLTGDLHEHLFGAS